MQSTSQPEKLLSFLRANMQEAGVDAYWIPSADEHQNEFLADHKKRRQAITGFSGSAGDALVTMDEVHLWVDSRYHIQAEKEAPQALIHKLGIEGTLTVYGWISQQKTALKVGYDPLVGNADQIYQIKTALNHPHSSISPIKTNLVDQAWQPQLPPASQLFALPLQWTGEKAAAKLLRIQEIMRKAGVSLLLVNKLDEMAWLTNLRGRDIPYNPVFTAYGIVTLTNALCFLEHPPTAEVAKDAGLDNQFIFHPYQDFHKQLTALLDAAHSNIWLDKRNTSAGVFDLIPSEQQFLQYPAPIESLKAIKNDAEIAATQQAHLHAACAKARAFSTLDKQLAEGARLTENQFAELLYQEYAQEPDFYGLSFESIVGYGANSAIVHYCDPSNEVLLETGGLLLVDSGIQIKGGTTDDTRTVLIGNEATPEQKSRFTSVLRSHIRLAMQVFPQGVTGQGLDAIARSTLWNDGMDFGHGTGHGVGAFLNVHEGPHSISPNSHVPFAKGMVVSNEPGWYQDGWGGIRCENLYLVTDADAPPHPAGKSWLCFTPLTCLPFDQKLIAWHQLLADEMQWLSHYHGWVEQTLLPLLPPAHHGWLKAACAIPSV